MPTYDLTRGEVIDWCTDHDRQVDRGEAELFHGAFGDPPYCLEFMGSGTRDAPHRAFMRDYSSLVEPLVSALGLRQWEAAAVLWYRQVFSAISVCLLPGAPVVMCAGPRTDDLMAMGMRAAGLDVRTKLIYMYGSGMPHGLDLGKAAGPEWDGYGTEFKPAYETLIYAIKPFPGTYANAARQWGTVGLNIDESRIEPTEEYLEREAISSSSNGGSVYGWATSGDRTARSAPDEAGRWPSTVLLQHDDACGDDYCVRGCPVAALDQQSGVTSSRKGKRGNMVRAPGDSYGGAHAELPDTNTVRGHNDRGGASRFFYTSKVAAWEREAGLDGMQVYQQDRLNAGGLSNEPRFAAKPTRNPHPTLKSVRALIYLLRAIGRPAHVQGRLLVPFAGTGSEMIAGMLAGNWSHVQGIELDQDQRYPGAFVPIGQARLEWWSQFRRYEDARRAVAGERVFKRKLADADDLGQLALFN